MNFDKECKSRIFFFFFLGGGGGGGEGGGCGADAGAWESIIKSYTLTG